MSAALVRLALLQLIAVVLSVLLAGWGLKAHFGSGSHFPIFATYARDYGIFLLLVPTAWAIWGALELNRPVTGAGDGRRVFVSGVVLPALLGWFGCAAFTSAMSNDSLVMARADKKSVAETRSKER